MKMLEVGRWYRWERFWEKSVRKSYSSFIYVVVVVSLGINCELLRGDAYDYISFYLGHDD